MWGNFDAVRERISGYNCFPDPKYKTVRGLPKQEENVEQKLRQYWADKTIPNSVKLEGLDIDLSKFDPKNTSNKEMRDITRKLSELGILDDSTCGWLHGVDVEFNSLGNEINIGKKTDLFAYFERHLKIYSSEISAGYTIVKDAQTSLFTAVSVVKALQERGEMLRTGSLVDANA